MRRYTYVNVHVHVWHVYMYQTLTAIATSILAQEPENFRLRLVSFVCHSHVRAYLGRASPRSRGVLDSPPEHRRGHPCRVFGKPAGRCTGEARARRLSTQERSSRLQALQTKLGSFRISGQYEPSHQLVEAFNSMLPDQSIRHVPLNRCSCREQEVSNLKRDEHLLRLENSALRSSELRVAQALSRRGLAMDMAGLGTFEVREAYARSLLEYLRRPPPPKFDPPGIDAVYAVLRADREMWVRVADEVGSDFTGPGKATAVDDAIKKWQHSMWLTFLSQSPSLKSLRSHPTKGLGTQPFFGDKGGKGKGKNKFMQQAWQSGKSGKGKTGKGKDKTQLSPSSAQRSRPKLRGKPICFNHSLPHGCSEETWQTDLGLSCRRGLHICMKCHGDHSYSACDK